MKLTDKQKAFCDYYIETLNATESYKKAGYKVKNDNTAAVNANRLLRNAKIKSYIDKRLKEIENDRIADAKEVMEYLTAVMRGEEVEEVVGFTEDGPEIAQKLPYVKDRVRAAELLGKRYALFTDKVNLDANVGVKIIDDIEDDADEED